MQLMETQSIQPWASFCLSTYNRPSRLKSQLELLANQTFKNFEVIISDNDVERSAERIVQEMNDCRFKYFANDANLGMIKSFNQSIRRSNAEYIVMVTDDDPVKVEMLEEFCQIIDCHPGYSIYCGCIRLNKEANEIETFNETDFIFQLLHPKLTANFLWSSCVLKKETVLKVGSIPDYGSPHFADHALLALCSKFTGGLFINKMYSFLTAHDENFSKKNFELYYTGCVEFRRLIQGSFEEKVYKNGNQNALSAHLEKWFIDNSFALRNYFTYHKKNLEIVKAINAFSKKILALDFMAAVKIKYYLKLGVFYCKMPIYLIKKLIVLRVF